ncbi:MAG: DNA-binding protein [Alcanivorax sp.]|nr:DNA-binding protein [Alcanivorax sp.]|tara:strand:+ start:816 stop:1199 length:384 start_codon:yes stop_codon:yes gene_type:complete
MPVLLAVGAFFAGLAILAPAPEWWWFVGFYALMSALSFSLYGLDKRAAMRGGRRTPEARLHFIELLGGWPGALLAQRVFRHKTRKTSFQVMYYLAVAANLAALVWLFCADVGEGLRYSLCLTRFTLG